MPWWSWFAGRNKNRRVHAAVTIPETGAATIQITPHDAAPEDLSLLALCYASKVRWLMLSEPQMVGGIFQELYREARDFWLEEGSDLIDRMPTAKAIREDRSGPRAVSGGEHFSITLFRTDYQNLENRAWVINKLPRTGLAANVPLSGILVLNAVFAMLAESDRTVLQEALSTWYEQAFASAGLNRSLSGLGRLYDVSLASMQAAHWE